MDVDALIQFDKELLLALNGSDSLFLDGLVLTLTKAATWIPLYLALFYVILKNNENVRQILTILACAGLCVFIAGSLDDMFVKPLVARWRPTHDPQIGILVDTVNGYRGGSYGFFSAHASNTFSIAIFFCLLIRSRALSISLVAWSLVNCWTRLYLGVHYPGDILCGLLWGGLTGTAVYYVYAHFNPQFTVQRRFTSSQYTSTGYQKSDADVAICVLMFTFFYAIVRACLMLYVN
ncbi:MAG: phosphatase PAP2 family protein [Prevotella sp.]|nr:phosphatase PAP2 family protein [Prevotella sp.]